jgi:S1-C subfamily serine protease
LVEQNKLGRDYGALLISGVNPGEPAVEPRSPADKAGLQENDIILEINGHRVDQNNTLAKELKNYNVGDIVRLKIYRAGQEKTISVTIGEAK